MPRQPKERKPNWHEWLNIPTVSVEEAVALSCDIDPKKVQRTTRPIGRAFILESDEFLSRLHMAERNAVPGGALGGWGKKWGNGPLREFLSWARTLGWKMPAELEGIASAEQEPPKQALGEKERLTFQKLILGLALGGYRYDPKAKRSPVVAEICRDLADFAIKVDEDTVRNKLKEAATAVDWKPRE